MTQFEKLTPLHSQTKIIWSFYADILDDFWIKKIGALEVDCLRLVLGEDSVTSVRDKISKIRKEAEKNHLVPPSILMDFLPSVRGRISKLKEPRDLNLGDRVTLEKIDPEDLKDLDELARDKNKIFIHCKCETGEMFKKDSHVFFGYGNLLLKVENIEKNKITALVEQGGKIFSHMEIHVPETKPVPSISDIPLDKLKSLLKNGVEYIVVPGVSQPKELAELRERLKKEFKELAPWIFLNVDSFSISKSVNKYLPYVDGLFVPRMEMALSMNPSLVPIVTKEMIQRANDFGKVVIVASEMLGSMRRNITPTRAEVSDIANAVLDGSDAVVLSEEIPFGSNAEPSLQMMRSIIESAEKKSGIAPNWIKLAPAIKGEFDAVSYTAYKTAERLKAKAIVCITKEGNTPLRLASYRAPIPVIAVTFSKEVLQKLKIVRGVTGLCLDIEPNIDQVFPRVNEKLLNESWLSKGDVIIFVTVSISPIGKDLSNLFSVQRLF